MNQDKSFHLYLLIGQSNMAGRGEVESQDREIHPRVFTLDKTDEWVPAADPIHFDGKRAAVGPGLTFGRAMADDNSSIRIGLIPSAVGASIISAWKHGSHWKDKANIYDNAIRRARIAMKNGVLKGILWHQGEGDSNETDAELYKDRLSALVGAVRTDLGAPDVPFIVGTLCDTVAENRFGADTVNETLRSISQRVKHTACADAAGLKPKDDNVHFNAESARELGRRYAKAMIRLLITDKGE